MFTYREHCIFVNMKQEMLHIALDNFKKITGMDVLLKDITPLDGVLEIPALGNGVHYVVELKQEIRPHQVQQLEYNSKEYGNFMVVANQIFPKVKDELRAKGIAYMETNGNTFIKQENIFLFIDTQKTSIQTKEKGNRAFTKTGLKVLLHLLNNKADINLPQRELAKLTKVGLGSIPQVIEGLKETGYLLQLKNKTYVWENRKELLDRWVIEYDTVLKPKLKKERYDYQGNWEDIVLVNELTVWGGEPAADILTNYLRPEKLIIYTKENRLNLMKNYRLIPKANGQIEAYEMFWEQDKQKPTAPPILVYAELLLEGGKRNNETATKIFNEYIQPKL